MVCAPQKTLHTFADTNSWQLLTVLKKLKAQGLFLKISSYPFWILFKLN